MIQFQCAIHNFPWPWWPQSFNENHSFLMLVVNKEMWRTNEETWTHNFLLFTFSSFECLNILFPCTRVRHHSSHSWEMVVGHQKVLWISSHIDNLKSTSKGIETDSKQNREMLLLSAEDRVIRRILDYPICVTEHACIFCEHGDHIFQSAQTEFQCMSVVLDND